MAHFTQYRPEGSGGPMYAPHRDLAHRILPLFRRVMDTIEAKTYPAWVKFYLDLYQISDQELVATAGWAASTFAFAPDPTLGDIGATLEQAGPIPCPPALGLVYMLLGLFTHEAGFTGFKETIKARQEELPEPAATVIKTGKSLVAIFRESQYTPSQASSPAS